MSWDGAYLCLVQPDELFLVSFAPFSSFEALLIDLKTLSKRQKYIHSYTKRKLTGVWGGTSSVVKCPPLNCKVGCSIHGHWVNGRSTPWARVFTKNRPVSGQISGFGLPLTAVIKNRIKKIHFTNVILHKKIGRYAWF